MKFDRVEGTFEFVFASDPAIGSDTEIFVPRIQYPKGCVIEVSGGAAELDLENQRATVRAFVTGEVEVIIRRR